ncbi:hypothetical protein [Streptomyces sp. NBC_00091]|uniref:hypothetical protein n=1 Tax=Streptomyces sp. NBC_00091 TaxID=2975648 RepID=UPI00225681A8|nr:hypothetical protein [Streptomyces sp. NBC_00091]MCX5380010.1 hypothetical protein [Streptomyces sp. NBC_00091]
MGSPEHQIRRAPAAGPALTALTALTARPPEQAVATDRWRYARHLDRLAAAGAAGAAAEAGAVAEVLRDADPVMAQSAVVTHLDRRALRLAPGAGFHDWARALRRVLDGHAFPARRLREWTLLKAIGAGGEWSPEELAAASDWCQRTASQSRAGDEALALLAASGRTRRVRNAAARRLHRRATS